LDDLESRVWMVHVRTSPEGVKGTVRLEASALVFRPAAPGADELAFPLTRIRRARRVRGSPVLELLLTGEGPGSVGFYFVQPPSLEGQQEGRFRGRAKRDAAVALVTSNLSKKEEVARWVRAIREARKRG
jgi:hypothetical protein